MSKRDVVERLREGYIMTIDLFGIKGEILVRDFEAADEIETLRAEREKILRARNHARASARKARSVLSAFRAEIARLKSEAARPQGTGNE